MSKWTVEIVLGALLICVAATIPLVPRGLLNRYFEILHDPTVAWQRMLGFSPESIEKRFKLSRRLLPVLIPLGFLLTGAGMILQGVGVLR